MRSHRNGAAAAFDKLARHERVAVLLDYDGTLVPILPRPEEAVLPEPARATLRGLSKSGRARVGVLSGRGLDELRRMVGVDGVFYAGAGGLEVLLGDGRWSPPEVEAWRDAVNDARAVLAALAAAHAGAWVEDKRIALAVHYRACAPEAAQTLKDAVLAEAARRRLRALEGNRVLEVLPGIAWGKADAARLLLAEAGAPGPHWGVLYAGDDQNDADAMQLVREIGGAAVGVGPRAPKEAEFYAEGPDEIRRLLAALAAALSA
jgi:trehalose 6-phosphate phosphatase